MQPTTLNCPLFLLQAGGPGLEVDPAKIVWTPYNAEREYAKLRD